MIGAWRDKAQRSMGPPAVVVGAVLGEDGPQVPFPEDQDAVGELRPAPEEPGLTARHMCPAALAGTNTTGPTTR
jgi:hypothetical protein